MTISSRTSGGIPHRCPTCGHEEDMEASVTAGDSCCPACGQLMWMQEDSIAARVAKLPREVREPRPATKTERTMRPAFSFFRRIMARYAPGLFNYFLMKDLQRDKRQQSKISVS